MGLLSKIVQSVGPKKALFEQHFTQAKSFRGFKRFRVSYRGYEPVKASFEKFRKKGMDLDGADIHLKQRFAGDFNEYEFVDVAVNGYQIGSVLFWDCSEEQASFLKNILYAGKVDKACIRIEPNGVVVGYNKKGKRVEDEDFKISLFLHEQDQ